jgi:hypothetical protein
MSDRTQRLIPQTRYLRDGGHGDRVGQTQEDGQHQHCPLRHELVGEPDFRA